MAYDATDDDDAPLEVDISDGQPTKGKKSKVFEYDEDSENLARDFQGHPEGEKALKEIALQVRNDFDVAWESTEEYRERQANDWKIFAGNLPRKTGAFKDAANVHIPVMLENLTRITFRSFDELFGDWTKILSVLPVNADDTQVAEILTRHGNWQFTYQIKDFYRQQARAMLLFYTNGDVTAHSYHNESTGTNCHDTLTCEDFVIPYVHTTTTNDYSDVPFKVKVMNLYRHDLQKYKHTWVDVDKVLKRDRVGLDDDPEQIWSTAANEQQGIIKPADQRSAPYKVLWYEGWTDKLPNQEDDRYVRVILDYGTNRVLSLMIYEQPNWEEQARFEKQSQELDDFGEAQRQHKLQIEGLPQQRQQLLQEAQEAARNGMPIPPADFESQLSQLDPQMIPPPPPPSWMTMPEDPNEEIDLQDPRFHPEVPRMEPINLFSHGVCIEPIVGNLGIGFGRMQSDFNKAENTMFSQAIDSATLGNVWGLITAGNLEFEKPFSFAPGSVNIARGVTGSQLKDAIHEMRPAQANPQMFELIDRIWQYAQSSAQAPDVLSGQAGKSGETFRGISARIEQAQKQLSVPTRSYAKTFLGQIIINNAKLNEMFLPDDELVQVGTDPVDGVQQIKVSRKLYERNYHFTLGADLRFASREQRISDADEIVAMQKDIPAMQKNIPFLQKALAGSLKERGRRDLIPYLGPLMDAPQTPLGLPPPPPPPQLGPDGKPIAQPQPGNEQTPEPPQQQQSAQPTPQPG